MITLTTATLRRALGLQEEIESLQDQLARILGKNVSLRGSGAVLVREDAVSRRGRKPGRPAKAVKAGRRGKRTSPFKGKKRPSSPSGPLGAAVAKVLKRAAGPMNVDAILQGLKSEKYVWNVSDPKKNLAARLYTLKGVKKSGPGLFVLKKK
ncbi:MAG: hypothetical protein JHD33_08465 [Chthoniobacterales bacterium]|nr:hypothetical protein [Chthoniobacterales bacterium]